MAEEEDPQTADGLAMDVMGELGCTCGVEPYIELACASAAPSVDIHHVQITITYHFAHASACLLGQVAVSDLN